MHDNDAKSDLFAAGSQIEKLGDVYTNEEKSFESMKLAFVMASKCLDDFKIQLLKDAEASRLTLKESEYGTMYISRCIDLIGKLFNDAEAKRLKASGAAAAIEQSVKIVKVLYDDRSRVSGVAKLTDVKREKKKPKR